MEEGSDTSKNFCIGVLAKFRVIFDGIPLVNEGNTKNDYTRFYMATGERP